MVVGNEVVVPRAARKYQKKNPRARHGGFMLGNTLCRYSSSGKTKFKTTANSAVGATAEVASVFQIPGRY